MNQPPCSVQRIGSIDVIRFAISVMEYDRTGHILATLKHAGESSDAKGIVVNLAGTQVCSCADKSLLVRLLKRTRERQIPLVLCHVDSVTMQSFQIVRLDEVFTIVGTEAEAIESLNQGGWLTGHNEIA